jgi:glutathione S-transferase
VYQLYWAKDSGALAPQILLEEVGAEYERCELDLDRGQETAAEFLKINPRGQVPALVLGDGSIITESAAISLYIAESHVEAGLLPPSASVERAQVYRWLFYASANLYESVLRLYYADRFTTDPTQVDPIQASARVFIDQSWELLENELGQGPYLLGQTYSLIDPYLLMLTNWHEQPEVLFERNPKLRRLCETVRSRPAVARIWSQHFPEA